MSFTSFEFIIFFPIVCIGYFIIPWNRLRNIWLLLASYVFYMSWNAKYALLLLAVTTFCYAWSILVKRCNLCKGSSIKISRFVLGFGVSVPIFLLFLFKYAQFCITTFASTVGRILPGINSISINLLLPVGISFYIFQNVSYLIDVYRKDIEVEYNFIDYALYISFFPQLVAGPIELSKEFLAQFKTKHSFDYDRVKRGLMCMLWGYFIKLLIADRVGIYVDAVFGKTGYYPGAYQLVAALIFPLQIYTDFYGYSSIALGAGEVMGFKMTDNFYAPFLSESFADLWRRWHVSLYNWFRNYVYYPLGGNKKGTARKYLNLLIVCSLSGLWHGANWTFVVWGLLLGLFQIIEALLIGKRKSKSWFTKILRVIITYTLFSFCFIFFRATTFTEAANVLRSIVIDMSYISLSHITDIGISWKSLLVLLLSTICLFISDLLKVKGISIRDWIMKRNIAVQWGLLWVALIAVVVFGIYGNQDNSFIYFVF